jgi:hypothetical protein
MLDCGLLVKSKGAKKEQESEEISREVISVKFRELNKRQF